MENIVKLENISKSFGKFKALDNVNLEINQGEVHGFIGPNGAGKTTTIRIILGLLKADTGKALIFDKDAFKDNVIIHQDIAYVPGDVNLWKNLTGGQVIDLLLKFQGEINHDKKEQLIKDFQLDPKKKCGSYSKGNRQKVALIAAFASNAKFFILDEPTSGLDPLMEQVFRSYVAKAKEEGKTILLSSHILSEVEQLCDMITIIKDGKIVDTGSLVKLQHLRRTNFKVITDDHLDLKQDYIYNLKHEDTIYEFSVDSSHINNVMTYLSKHSLTSLQANPPSLEELFMTHYQSDGSR